MNWYKTSQTYVGNCTEVCETDGGSVFEDANEMQQVVEQDDFQYPATTYFHNPQNQITMEEFEKNIDWLFIPIEGFDSSNRFFIGKNQGFIFVYDGDKDLHYFWRL